MLSQQTAVGLLLFVSLLVCSFDRPAPSAPNIQLVTVFLSEHSFKRFFQNTDLLINETSDCLSH